MKKTIAIVALSLLAACSTTVIEDDARVNIDDLPVAASSQAAANTNLQDNKQKSFIAFTGSKGNIISHECAFTEFGAQLVLDAAMPDDLTKATLILEADITSMVTESEGLTKHLLSADFFEAETFKKATFNSTTISLVEGNNYTITGNLTIKDVTKEVTVNATLTRSGVQFKYDLDRTEFNVGPAPEGLQAIDAIVPVEVQIIFE